MKKQELYAIHKDGRRLYLPSWDSQGEITETGRPTAAVTITQEGKTFPEGSVWIRKQRCWKLQDGWKLV
jgi:hypothetical protein